MNVKNEIILEEDELSVYEKEIEVNPFGKIKKIQDAIDLAEPRTKIKIKRGIYKGNLIIRGKYDLEIFSEDPNDPAIILSDNGPCVKIEDMEEDHNIKLMNLRFVQRGVRYDNEMEQYDKHNGFIYQNASMLESLEINYTMDINVIEGIIEDNRGALSAISIFGGTVMISNCQITLAFLTSETNKIVPAIYSEDAILFTDSVFIKGNTEFLTVGILSYNANLKMTSCKIVGHRCGGVLCILNDRNTISIAKTQILENTGCGFLAKVKVNKSALMEKSIPLRRICEINIEDNLIEKNKGVGLKILNCFNVNFVGNKIIENLLNGAELTDCSGLVMLNSFFKNKGAGALLEAVEETFDAKIFKNTFHENLLHGVIVKGENNFANIYQNDKIGNNYLSGIYVQEKASPKIFGNTIFKNLHQGILVVSDSSAFIESNMIYDNIRANIAFGGKLAENTRIINNDLSRSRSEGIFIIEAKGGLIARNKIYDNNDGVIMIKCKDLELSENEVYKNIRCGVLVSDQSSPKMFSNKIFENNFLGLFIRDESEGYYDRNELHKNISQFYLSKDCKSLLMPLQQNNKIEGRFDVASKCSIL